MDLTFYTDGSCIANGKENAVGGYGVVGVDKYNSVQFVRAKRTKGTTNNREELKAILYVMLNYGEKCDDWGQPPIVYSDSAYCVNTFNEWMFNWARNN
jgi:ribonuclease HI